MCGIIAVVRRPSTRSAPSSAEVLEPLTRATVRLADAGAVDGLASVLADAADLVNRTDRLLRGVAGVTALIDGPALLI